MFKQRIEGMILGIGTSILLILSISNHVCALDVQQAIDDGVSWLLDRQGDNGAWAPRYTARTNALAVRAYVATGRTADPNYVLLLSKLNELQAADGSWDENVGHTGHAIRALIDAWGTTESTAIVSAAAWLRSQQNADGGWGAEGSVQSYSLQTAVAIIALVRAGDPIGSQVITDGVNWLKTNQNPDGYWGYYPGDGSHSWLHPSPIVALCVAGHENSPETTQAISYLKSHYSASGGVSSHLEAFVIAEVTDQIQNSINGLLGVQGGDGGWGSPSRDDTTAQAILHLAEAGCVDPALDDGISWIEQYTSEDGSFSNFYQSNTYTAYCAVALSLADANTPAQMGVDLIVADQRGGGGWYDTPGSGNSTPGSTGPVAWLLGVYGLAPSSPTLVGAGSYLKNTQNGDGGWGYFSSSPSDIFYAMPCLLGLTYAGYSMTDSDVEDGLDYLLLQNTSGNWGDTYHTALGSMILHLLDTSPVVKENAITWLKANQNLDGGWGARLGQSSTVNSTAMVLIVLDLLGEEGIDIDRGIAWLVAAQNSDRGWSNLPGIPSSSPEFTAKAIWALSASEFLSTLDVNVATDEQEYHENNTVEITVTASEAIVEVTGFLTNPDAWLAYLTFTQQDPNTFTSSFDTTACSPLGTYAIAVRASTSDGRIGVANTNFNVLFTEHILGDLNNDGKVNLTDLALLSSNWLRGIKED